ncbi:MAG TPA: anthranilate synthase component I [Casimicrobiaceae bacterium]|nr:anthranilate synthase component I [Casimicrobiaceae bacterium]
MGEAEFRELARKGYNRIPLVLETFADLDTPLSLYLKLAAQPFSYLLESVVGGERFGRYSFIGVPARKRIRAHGRRIEVLDAGGVVEHHDGNPLDFVRSFLSRFKAAPLPGLPRFAGGLAGCFGYDTVRHIEPRLADTAPSGRSSLDGMPDILLLASEELAVVDNLKGRISLIVYADPAVPDAYEDAVRRIESLRETLRAPVQLPEEAAAASGEAQSAFGKKAFTEAVLRAKEYIAAGDIMQVVLSQRLTVPFSAKPIALYRALRSLNPSPYMFYYDFGDFHVVGASPEILVRKEGATVTVRPIAGTRPRGATGAEDEVLARELLDDEKERAEHVMLLDLGRNDVGRVAVPGSVRVTEQMAIERYSHVMHIVSGVEGTLRPGLSALDVLRAAFPAGTVSGAPKVRAMEIIDELEPIRRGVYAGAVGYLSFHDDMDLAITIRTAVIRDGRLHVQAGAGIVHDSDPQSEWAETGNKAQALLKAAEIAQRGLDPPRK